MKLKRLWRTLALVFLVQWVKKKIKNLAKEELRKLASSPRDYWKVNILGTEWIVMVIPEGTTVGYPVFELLELTIDGEKFTVIAILRGD